MRVPDSRLLWTQEGPSDNDVKKGGSWSRAVRDNDWLYKDEAMVLPIDIRFLWTKEKFYVYGFTTDMSKCF